MFATWLDKCRDKSRQLSYQVSRFFGESDGIKPESIQTTHQAQASLKVDIPSFKTLLPYESMTNQGVFINRHSMGIGLALMPLAGADESLVKTLAALIQHQLPKNVDCTIWLYKHPYIQPMLEKNLAPFLKKGGIYKELANLSLNYQRQALLNGYTNGRHIPAQLTDYMCYAFLSLPKTLDGENTLLSLCERWESELQVAGFSLKRLDKKQFQTLLRTLVSPNRNQTDWPDILDDSNKTINDLIPDPSSLYQINELSLDISSLDENGASILTRLVNMEISHYPQHEWGLWQTPDLFSNCLNPEQGIPCPFLISFTLRGSQVEKMNQQAKKRTKSLQTNNNAIQRFLNPAHQDELNAWQFVYEESSKGNSILCQTVYNLILFTSVENERDSVAKAISAYRQCGFTLTPARCKQWLAYLGSLPFFLTEGLFSSLNTLGLIKTLTNQNIANLLPLIADFKGSEQGVLLPTYRHQAFFFDPFDDKHLPITNYNRLINASPGAGKTYLQQAFILDGLARDHLIFVIDLGESYKHLCQLLGGTYLDATTLSLNPFTLFDFEGVTHMKGQLINDYIQIRDLLAIMASPHQALGEVQKAWLLDATLSCWKKHKHQSCMDDILDALTALSNQLPAPADSRLTDLHLLLSRYGKQGMYGKLFNNPTPLIKQSNFVVLELGGLKNNPELLTIVLFVLIVIIQGQFYQSDRRIKKQCIIDEAWQFLAAGSNPIAATFIEQGFRTARKYNGGFSVITQQLSDTTKTAQGQAIAGSADTKIILRQRGLTDYLATHPHALTPLQQTIIESFGEAKSQGFSNVMIQYGNAYTVHRYFSDPFSRILFSTSADEFSEVEALVASGLSLKEAIQNVVKKKETQS